MDSTNSCDLRHMFGNVRDQYSRPTCVAFAVSDAHAAVRPNWNELSCEYAFFQAISRHKSDSNDGVSLENILEVIYRIGQPLEQIWPYLMEAPNNLVDWQPPQIDGILFKRNSKIMQCAVIEILRKLVSGLPVILTICLSEAFFSNWDDNGILDSSYAPDQTMRHAVVAVGFMSRNNENFILIRNSWGVEWCINGYGWVSEHYLTLALLAIAVMKEDLTYVSSN